MDNYWLHTFIHLNDDGSIASINKSKVFSTTKPKKLKDRYSLVTSEDFKKKISSNT